MSSLLIGSFHDKRKTKRFLKKFLCFRQEIFEKMDWDKNGTVSPIEFKSYLANLKKGEDLNSEDVYRSFDKIDKDGSKQIQWEEFLVNFCADLFAVSINMFYLRMRFKSQI